MSDVPLAPTLPALATLCRLFDAPVCMIARAEADGVDVVATDGGTALPGHLVWRAAAHALQPGSSVPLVDAPAGLDGAVAQVHLLPTHDRSTLLVLLTPTASPVTAEQQAALDVAIPLLTALLDAGALPHPPSLLALRDEHTRLYTAAAWDDALAREEERCRRYGRQAAVVGVALARAAAPPPHDVARAVAQALLTSARGSDLVARLDTSRFAVLGVECDRAGAQALVDRIEAALEAQGIDATLKMAARHPLKGLPQAAKTALG